MCNNMKVLNVTELYTLKWEILCYVNFITIKSYKVKTQKTISSFLIFKKFMKKIIYSLKKGALKAHFCSKLISTFSKPNIS